MADTMTMKLDLETLSEVASVEDEVWKRLADRKRLADIELKILNQHASRAKETFMLSAPKLLTVKRKDGSYGKENHVGSEDFSLIRIYKDKTSKKTIAVFKPVMIAGYAEVEMPVSEAVVNLLGFSRFLDDVAKNAAREAEKLEKIKTQEQEKKATQSRFDTYKDLGFGSW